MELKRPNIGKSISLAVKMNDCDVRFTPNGKQLAIIYTNLYPGIRLEVWKDEIIVALADMIWPPDKPRASEPIALEVTGTLEIKYLLNIDKETIAQNVFTVNAWRLAAK